MEVGLGSKRWHIYFSSTTASAILRTSYHQYYFTATKVFFAGAGAAVVASGCIHGILGIPVPSSNLAQGKHIQRSHPSRARRCTPASNRAGNGYHVGPETSR